MRLKVGKYRCSKYPYIFEILWVDGDTCGFICSLWEDSSPEQYSVSSMIEHFEYFGWRLDESSKIKEILERYE